ncbi:Unknown protein, partial [Striga hermonthica]
SRWRRVRLRANKEMKDKIDNLDVQVRSMSEAMNTLGDGLDITKASVHELMEIMNRRFDEMTRNMMARQSPPRRPNRDRPDHEGRREREHDDDQARRCEDRELERRHDRERHDEERRYDEHERDVDREQQREEYEREDDFDRRSQASNRHDRPKPEKPKLVLSTFTGADPDAWLNRAAQYFELNEIEGSDRVKYAAYYLDGEANVWWQWLTSVYRGRRQVIRWNDFERELLTRFGTSDYHNYNEALSRIRQTGSLRDYLKEFERLAYRVRGWPETAL